MENKVLLYGATGYTAQLVIEEMLKKGIKPILAGRSKTVESIGQKYSLQTRIFDLEDTNNIQKYIADTMLVVNLAGPFQYTSEKLIQACLYTRTHYIDIAGEVKDFEKVYAFDKKAQESEIMLMPGAGFGVVPTDVAAYLSKQNLPDAHELTIAFATQGGVSQGTLKTVLKDMNEEGVKRVEGQLISCKPAENIFDFTLKGKKHKCVSNPWRADIFSAYYTTQIPNIKTYSAFPAPLVLMMRNKWLFGKFTKSKLLQTLITKAPKGPTEKELNGGKTWVYAEAKNQENKKVIVNIEGPEAYMFTAQTVTQITKYILSNDFQKGFQTPAKVYGAKIIENLNVQVKVML
ncbi:MAG: saccharopine dehydrogenase NADP-binding domain-containing protein [Raineya sp.]|jgi:short subunit dehydrogenase-like uncharacterized protein|nr:saccharopine dehydrogenase NADP-binding domain-containing protein [Raineya sp.]